METENQTEETQVDESQLNSAAGNEAESVATASLTLAEINSLTGKDYKDKETALKSIKDMSSMAGKAADLEGKLKGILETREEPKQEPDNEVKALREQLNQTQTEIFFSNNPEHKENRDLLSQLAKANNVTIQEAAELDVYKGIVEKVAGQSNRTVASSNSRVAQSGAKKEFDASQHAGNADALADYVTKTYFNKK